PALDYVWYGRCARPPRKAVPGRSERVVPREAGEQRTNPGRINQYAHRVAETEVVFTAMGCLTLNASFEPLTILPVRRALRLVIDRKAEILAIDAARVFRPERREMPCPSVIRLVRYVHVPRKFRRQVTNTFLFARDNYSCEYCGRHRSQLRGREFLTRDHIVPLSRGGENTWLNVVTACSPCNNRKGNHLPHEVGMRV